MSFRRATSASFSEEAGTEGTLALMEGFTSADADAGAYACCAAGGGGAGAAAAGSTGGACGVDPLTFGNGCAAPFVGLGMTEGSGLLGSSTASSGGDTMGSSATAGSTSACSSAGAGGGSTAGCASPPAAFCALAAARAAFSCWRFSMRANAFCFLIALLDGLRVDSDALDHVT